MNALTHEWLPALLELLRRECAVVRIVVAEVRGSAPREAGAFMLVSKNTVLGTIGGGRLEWESIAAARELLTDPDAVARVSKSVLGADLGQCCGGVVSVWLERFTESDLPLLRTAVDAGARGFAMLSSTLRGADVERRVMRGAAADESMASLVRAGHAGALPRLIQGTPAAGLTLLERLDSDFPAVWLYGAGHVGRSLARILAELPLRLTWIDSRAELKATPGMRYEPDPVASVSEAPVGAYFLVMTHSHPLDFRLCHEILQRDDCASLGLIGSASKAARFRSRLRREGFEPATVARLVCPIGIGGIHSKWPAAIAVAVAAQLLQQISAARTHPAAPDALTLHECSEQNCATCGRSRTTVTT